MTPADQAIAAVIASVDKGLAIEAGADILRKEADSADQHEKVSGHLRLIADAMLKHPDPATLCESNASRYNAAVVSGDTSSWGSVRVIHIVGAAEALDRAAHAVRSA